MKVHAAIRSAPALRTRNCMTRSHNQPSMASLAGAYPCHDTLDPHLGYLKKGQAAFLLLLAHSRPLLRPLVAGLSCCSSYILQYPRQGMEHLHLPTSSHPHSSPIMPQVAGTGNQTISLEEQQEDLSTSVCHLASVLHDHSIHGSPRARYGVLLPGRYSRPC